MVPTFRKQGNPSLRTFQQVTEGRPGPPHREPVSAPKAAGRPHSPSAWVSPHTPSLENALPGSGTAWALGEVWQ